MDRRPWYYDDWTEDEEDTVVHCAWYYDWTEDGRYAEDPHGESNLAWLCDECAAKAGDDVSHAGEDDLNDSPCWVCGK
ncbi:MAG TPA: hypothetical protein EYH32_03275 [Anaerolineae bacterium]|nr:hypothetical protein [Anaerolineae bacterium]